MARDSKRLQAVLENTLTAFKGVLADYEPQLRTREIGTVKSVSQGIARVSGLPNVRADELIRFPGDLLGIAFNLDPDEVGAILLGNSQHLGAGDEVYRTGRVMDVPVGEALLGRVVDGMGNPLDEGGPVEASTRFPIERQAPAILDRAPVTVPLQTGLKAVDALIPIGRGQRELIVGDRQTGKTAVALDTMPFVAKNPSQTDLRLGAIIFGSERGLCGQFNEQILTYALEQINRLQREPEKRVIAAVGARLVAALENSGQGMAAQFSGPSSVTGITATVQVILLAIEQWQSSHPPIDRIVLFYNQYLSGTSCRPQKLRLLPLDLDWLSRLGQQPWLSESGALPFFTLDWERLFSALIRQYLFVSLYRAFAESLASENASRLTSMQTAEKNIEERLGELNTQYRHLRQSSITAEILDIVAGFEALTSCVIKQ